MSTINNELVLTLNTRRAKQYLAKIKLLREKVKDGLIEMQVADYTISWYSRPARNFAWELNSMDLLRLQLMIEKYLAGNQKKDLVISRKSVSRFPLYSAQKKVA